MNRTLAFGIALFLAVVGIALVTVDTSVEAGHKCKCKKNDCCAPACCAPSCCAPACCAPADCCPPPSCCGCHGVAPAPVEAAPAPAPEAAPEKKEAAPAPAAPPSARTPFGFRTVSFQR